MLFDFGDNQNLVYKPRDHTIGRHISYRKALLLIPGPWEGLDTLTTPES